MSPIQASPFTPCLYCLITNGTALARTNPCPLHPPSDTSTPSSPDPDTQTHLWHDSDSDSDEPGEAASIEHQGMWVVCPEPVRRKELVRGVIEGWDRRLKREGGLRAGAEGWERRKGRGRGGEARSMGEGRLELRPAPPRIIITPPDEDQCDVLSTPSPLSSSTSPSPSPPSLHALSAENSDQAAAHPGALRRAHLDRRAESSVSSPSSVRSTVSADAPTMLSPFVRSFFQALCEIDESEGVSSGISEEEQERVGSGEELG